jgi:predicted solute-binding protein
MNIRVGYIPYLNMVPFHHGFGPAPVEAEGRRFEFLPMSPHLLGLEAEKGIVDAGALSLVDSLRLSSRYEPVGTFGIGVQRPAQSVLLFSRCEISRLQGMCAVTDDTATSFRLLQLLLEVRYGLSGIHYGRIASSALFDGEAQALLLIGDEALRAKSEGIKGLPFVTDLGEEWFQWQGVPFTFARWMVRSGLRQDVKDIIESSLQKSLRTNEAGRLAFAQEEAPKRNLSFRDIILYWNGFAYELTPDHQRSIQLFSELLEKVRV